MTDWTTGQIAELRTTKTVNDINTDHIELDLNISVRANGKTQSNY